MDSTIARTIYFGLQYLRNEPVEKALEDLRRSQFISLDELLAIQAKRQLEQLRFVSQYVPFYKKTYAPYKEQIHQGQTWEDAQVLMRILPVVEKQEVRDKFNQFIPSNNNKIKTHLDKTSGSSGTPLIFPCDQNTWAYRHALIFRCMANYGVRVGEPYAYFYGLHWENATRIKTKIRDLVLNRVRVSAFDMTPEQAMFHYKNIMRHKPTHFLGYPSTIYELCVLLRERGIDDIHKLRLKAVFLSTEPLRPYQRQIIEETTNSRCVDMYGSAEGGGNAFECPDGSLHISSEVTWVQPRDPNSQSNEIIVTDMMLRSFPMIRYAIGDDAIFKTGNCVCGRPHPMLESIEGRSGDPVILPNGRKINSHLTGYIFKALAKYGVIRRYRFVHDRGQGNLQLFIVVTHDFSDDHMKVIQDEAEVAFGEDVDLTINIVENIPHLPNAKHRDFIQV